MADQSDPHELAIRCARAERTLKTHLAAYAVVNATFVVIWAVTGAGFFWPIWPIAGWGVGLALNAWTARARRRPIIGQEIRWETGDRHR
jgi:hypothetical protein